MKTEALTLNEAVLLTPPQAGAIATMRLNGPLVESFAAMHLSGSPLIRQCIHCELRDGETLIDDPVAVLLKPDCLELHVHGGPWIIRSTLELLERFGFAARDWESTRMWIDAQDPVERRMLADLPRAMTREALAMLLAQPKAWEAMLARRDPAEMQRAVEDRALAALLDPPTVAIVGQPNVGKSTLANSLFARSHSITADLPGTTRDWVGERANVDGLIVTLVDTPGQRETADPIEAAAIGRAVAHVTTAQLVLLVEDAASPANAELRSLRNRYPRAIRILNKCDVEQARADATALAVSARTGAGLAALRDAIRSAFGCEDLSSPHARCWTNQQRAWLLREGGEY